MPEGWDPREIPRSAQPLFHAMPIPGQHTASPAAETVRPDGPGRQDCRAAEKCWHLITIGKTNRWRAATEALQRASAAMGAEEGAPELFAPRVCRLHGAESGCPRRVEAPLLLNYAFLRASAAELRTLRAACPEVNPVIDRTSEASAEGRRRYVTLSDAAVEAFRRIAAAEADNLPVYAPGEIDLTTADTVRVVDGPFRGIVGRIVRQRGSSACRIALEIGNGYFASTIRIEPRYIALEAFAPRPRAIYDILDAYIERRLLPLLRNADVPAEATEAESRSRRPRQPRGTDLFPEPLCRRRPVGHRRPPGSPPAPPRQTPRRPLPHPPPSGPPRGHPLLHPSCPPPPPEPPPGLLPPPPLPLTALSQFIISY